ncbi:MAG: FKBP-type peptidyl-prolyl cis-trans isomerase [Phycisphaerales bacterium]|nr:FKBP-type peptidyl-prolyl cis-trans isomerase [Phycisphaerales bacterium]
MNSERLWAFGMVVGAGVLVACAGAMGTSLHTENTEPAAAAKVHADLDPETVAYAVGYYLGDEVRLGLEADAIDVDRSKIVEGFVAALAGQDPDLTEQAMADALARAHDIAAERVLDLKLGEDPDFRELYERNRARSAAFHESFASQPGAVTLESGAQYRPIATGAGAPAGVDATVVVTFQGALLDGRVFTEGEEAEVRISELNPGARELLALMKPGDWWQLAIPPELAYGGLGRPGMGIGPSETLIGDVRLLEVR